MSSRLDSKPQIWTLAADLGLSVSQSPTRSILEFVTRRIKQIARKFKCTTLSELLAATAGEVETVFEEVHSDADLQRIRHKYASMGELAAANLEDELAGDQDYAITFRKVHRAKWEPQFLSVIDCRGDKNLRSYFSKWHELAHLLTLTPQMRLVFRRTHSQAATKDPEEKLMDTIAGDVGFFGPFLRSDTESEVSFESIRRIRDECCPEASLEAATIAIVKALPLPCILVKARLALKKEERQRAAQLNLEIAPVPAACLRAVQVTVNRSAWDAGIRFHPNWRVPAESVISRVFATGVESESGEDLSWWVTSSGGALPPCPVRVRAKRAWDSVEALLVPQI